MVVSSLFGVDAGVGGMVCGRACVMVWGVCFGFGVLRVCFVRKRQWCLDCCLYPSPALSRTTRELFQSRCGLRPAGEGVVRWKVGCPVVGLDCVFGRCSVGCGVQKRQWRLDCCLYPLPDPPPLRASPCGGGSGSVVGLGLRAVTGFALTAPTFVGLRASR